MRRRVSLVGMRRRGLFARTREWFLAGPALVAAASLGLADQSLAQQKQTPGATPNSSAQTPKAPGQKTQTQAATPKTPAPQTHIPPGMRTLTLQEGRAIVQKMAWADDEEGLSPDCSHLVHTLYEQAGYPYTYANSLDLYRGAESFVRVRMAHAGDLIVWRGHVGIVINPKEHSFFSTTSAGARIAYYDSAYWRARGYARFYRYLTSQPLPSGRKTLQAANRPPEPAPRAEANSSAAENRPPDRAPKALSDSRAAADRPTVQAVKSLPVAPAAGTAPRGETTRAEGTPANPARANSSQQIFVRTAGKVPKAADVTSALEAANLEAGEILRGGDLWQLERPLVVYRELQVGAVEVKGKRGTAKVQVETLAALSAKRMEAQVGREEHQLEIQQTKKGWLMTPANGNAYVPRNAAMRILAARLAVLTQTAETSAEKEREQADIVRFMNLLVE